MPFDGNSSGLGLNSLFYGHRRRVEVVSRAGVDAARAKSQAGSAKREIDDLEERFERLTLACSAMWSLLIEKTDMKEEDLFAKIHELDMADGVEDGKITKTCQKCPACGRTMSERHRMCLYCGAVDLIRTPFDTI
jgi:ribosomal protein S27AE